MTIARDCVTPGIRGGRRASALETPIFSRLWEKIVFRAIRAISGCCLLVPAAAVAACSLLLLLQFLLLFFCGGVIFFCLFVFFVACSAARVSRGPPESVFGYNCFFFTKSEGEREERGGGGVKERVYRVTYIPGTLY